MYCILQLQYDNVLRIFYISACLTKRNTYTPKVALQIRSLSGGQQIVPTGAILPNHSENHQIRVDGRPRLKMSKILTDGISKF